MGDDGTRETVAFVADRGHGHDAHIPDKTSASVNMTAPYNELNIAFHGALIGYARNPHLARLEEKVSRDIHIYLREGVMAPQTLRISSKEHAANP